MFKVNAPKTKSEASSRSIITVGCEQALHDRLKLRDVSSETHCGQPHCLEGTHQVGDVGDLHAPKMLEELC